MKRIVYSDEALRALRKMPANMASRIRSKVEQYAADPQSLANNVKRLRGGDGALRIGDWRVIFRDSIVIAVIRIAPRGSAYD